ncbi:MAG TPA: threonine synthase [Vicinamibacterales bacterium]|nr:threonine synthase [Vicinamibacterales bacterium]
MQWISCRGQSPPVSFVDALFAGTAPDGGLYVPERIEPLSPGLLGRLCHASLVEMATVVGSHLFQGEISEATFGALVADALNFDVPLVQVTDRIWALELFHGPTLAFKDIGARVQARLLYHFTDGTPLTILVATSGDTGSAVAQAFYGLPDTRVVVLYPEGQVSDLQEAQMASLGGNIRAVAIQGTFDDCQRLVKTAFADDDLRKHVWLTPANSINVGRLLPQVFYYFQLLKLAGHVVAANLQAGLGPTGQGPIISVPSGNFGNLTAGLIAKRIGLPVRRFVAATNLNDTVPKYLQSGDYRPQPSVRTIANAMDVGTPSNFERIQWLYGHDFEAIRRDIGGAVFDDATVRTEIADVERKHGYLLDPHGAIGWLALKQAMAQAPADASGVFLATAHPAKFREVVEPVIGRPVPLPPALQEALGRPRLFTRMNADYAELNAFLRQ